MTTKERLHRIVDELSEAEADGARIVLGDRDRDELEAMLDEHADEILAEMDAEEGQADRRSATR